MDGSVAAAASTNVGPVEASVNVPLCAPEAPAAKLVTVAASIAGPAYGNDSLLAAANTLGAEDQVETLIVEPTLANVPLLDEVVDAWSAVALPVEGP